MAATVEEDLMQNPFVRVLRSSFESLYKHAAELGESTTVLVPCADCLESNVTFDQVFMETHLLQTTHVPGCYMNLLGQGVEVKETVVSTDLGFPDHRNCEVIQTESMYDFGNSFRMLVIDKPLKGRYKNIPGAAGKSGNQAKDGCAGGGVAGGGASNPAAWLNTAPQIEDWFYDQLLNFRKTFVQVPGCEQSTAERIREIVGDTTKKLIRHHSLDTPTQQRLLDYAVSRNAYALLHSFVFPHLVTILTPGEKKLEKAIRNYDSMSVEEFLNCVPGAAGRGLGQVDVRACANHLAKMDHEITPHEKIACINEAHSALQRCIAEGVKSAMEITGDDVLSLFIIAIRGSAVKDRLTHIAYVEMYLQGAAGRSGSNEAARFEEAGYAVSALQAAFQFFLEDTARGPSEAAMRGSGRSTGAFSSYGAGGSSGGGLGAAAFGDVDAGDDRNVVQRPSLHRGSVNQWR